MRNIHARRAVPRWLLALSFSCCLCAEAEPSCRATRAKAAAGKGDPEWRNQQPEGGMLPANWAM